MLVAVLFSLSQRQTCTLADARAVFAGTASSWHGMGTVADDVLQQALRSSDRFHVLDDLQAFTGLSKSEVMERLRRVGIFHYSAEHSFWNPSSSTELTWFYRSSIDYIFGLAWHGVEPLLRGRMKHRHLLAEGPILELAPGAGNNGLYLAMQAKVPYMYAGISLIETSFAQFRAAKRGLGPDRFRIIPPYTNWTLDPLAAFRPGTPHHGQVGMILAVR